MKVGVFDSGVGGLTVLKQAIASYPNAHYLYYADLDNVPYGTKSKKRIKQLVLNAVTFLDKKGIDILIVACNTATSVAIKQLRKEFDFPVVGMEPAVKPAIKLQQTQKKILVCATKLTLKEEKLKNLIINLAAEDDVELLSLQKLVTFAEKKKFESKKVVSYLDKQFGKLDWSQYKALVLGCTHFLFFKTILRSVVPPHVEIVDGNLGTVNRMLQLLPTDQKSSKLKVSYFVSEKKVKASKFEFFLENYEL